MSNLKEQLIQQGHEMNKDSFDCKECIPQFIPDEYYGALMTSSIALHNLVRNREDPEFVAEMDEIDFSNETFELWDQENNACHVCDTIPCSCLATILED